MKKILIIAIIICVSTVYSSATDHNSTIYTKCGQSIEVKILDELTPSQIQAFHDSITLRFPYATILDEATGTYNCHSFAWNLSDGGTTICWINQFNDLGQPNLSKYWTNDYYEETTEANAVKVFYYQSDHSAIVSPTVSGMYESKWGAWPLVRHAPDYGPYKKMYLRKYYAHFAPTPVYGSLQCSNISNSIGVNVSASYIAGGVPNNSTPYSYNITDNKGEDAIDNGKAIVNQIYFNGLNITFTHTGIYEIVISFKNQFNEYLGDYSYEQIVQ